MEDIRLKSRNLTKILIVEFAYCSILYFAYNVFIIKSKATAFIYVALLIILPFILNIYIYLRSKKKSNVIDANYAIIVQILVLIFSVKFLI